MMNKNYKIGFIGTGVMGQGMVANLLKAGYEVIVHNRTKSKADGLVKQGAVWVDDVPQIASQADVVITIVGFPTDVRSVYLDPDGIIAHACAGSYLIDMTTSMPSLAREIYQAACEKGIYALDAPVSGGDIGARNGTLTIMVGGDKESFAEVVPILRHLGSNVLRQGSAGAGQHTKMCNQITIASNMIGVCEALAYAKKAGLDVEQVLKSISSGAAASWSLANLAPRILKEDYEPGFYVKHFLKDLRIAIEESNRMGLKLSGLQLAKSLYEELSAVGGQDDGTQALYKLYEE
jgi:3-hydroxyisobutyrate dehydrogenase